MKAKDTVIEQINPSDLYTPLPDFITVNPLLTKENGAQYEIIRGSTHDGTLLFTKELLWETLKPIVTCRSFFKEDGEPSDTEMMGIKYEIGLITLLTEYHVEDGVDLPCGHYSGEIQETRMPVRCIKGGNDGS